MPRTKSSRIVRRESPGQACLPVELWQAAAGERVGAVAAEGGEEDLAEPVPGRMRRVAQRVLAVALQAGYPAAWLGQSRHLGEDLGGVGDVHQQGAGVHQVKGTRRQPGVPGVGLNDLDVAQPVLSSELACTGSRPVTRPPDATRSASRSMMPLGPQPRSIAL